MKHSLILSAVFCFSTGLFPGCAPEPEPPTEELPDVEADISALKAATEDWDAAWNAQDVEKLLSLYTEDAVRMPPNEAAVESKAAIRASVQQWFDEFTTENKSAVTDARVSGDLGYVRGTYESTNTPKTGGEPMVENGKWITVHQRQSDDSWKIICEMWSSNTPPSQ